MNHDYEVRLPQGWGKSTLGAVCDKPEYGWTTSSANHGNLKFLRTTDLSKGSVDWNSVPFCRENPPNIERYRLWPGDIVISRAGSVGRSFLVEECPETVFASYLIRFRPMSGMSPRYVSYFLQGPDYWREINKSAAGIALQNVNAKKLAAIPVPVAPLQEQRKIVAEIEKQFTRLDAAVKALKRVEVNLKRYRASVLKAACEGRLVPTEAELALREGRSYEPASELLKRILAERRARWEADYLAKFHASGKEPKDDKWKMNYTEPTAPDTHILPYTPEGWTWTNSDAIFTFVTSGSRGWAKYYDDRGARFLRIGNLDHDSIRLDLRQVQHVRPPEGAEGTRTRIVPGDVLISITADVGMIALVPEGIGEAYINQHVALGRPVNSCSREFVAWYLACRNGGQQQFFPLQRGATKKGLGLDDVRAIRIPMPPLNEQRRIVAEIDQRLSVLDELETQVEANLTRADRLRQAILKHAFEGKLVPQNSDDEPASILLERIRTEKDTGGSRVKRNGTKRKAQVEVPNAG